MIVTGAMHKNLSWILEGVPSLIPVAAAIPATVISIVMKMWMVAMHGSSNRILEEAHFLIPVHPVWRESGAVIKIVFSLKSGHINYIVKFLPNRRKSIILRLPQLP
jgi:hypothetical protein